MSRNLFTNILVLLLLPGLTSLLYAQAAVQAATQVKPCVILLHGLARTSDSMNKLAEALTTANYRSVNIDYESRSATIDVLANDAISRGLAECRAADSRRISIVTHSLGGILVRQYLSSHVIDELARVVMLAPPNKGSQVVDELSDFPGFALLNGPAGAQLGSAADSVPNTLGPVDFDLGVIAGTSTFNPLLSQLLPNPDDGKVSLESTRVEGMCGFLAMQESHTFIMQSETVIEQVMQFLESGRFTAAGAEQIDCEAS